jgi:fumarate reductase subunit D
VLLTIEIIVDKIPAADSLNDVIQTFVRPAAGAILFAASTRAIDLHPVLAVILGLVLAFGVHAVKATARPVVSVSTGGVGNAFVSAGEDVVSAGVSVMALAMPLLLGMVLIGLGVGWLVLRKR